MIAFGTIYSCVIVKLSQPALNYLYDLGVGKVITRKPRKAYNGSWCFSIDDAYTNTFYKPAKVSEAG